MTMVIISAITMFMLCIVSLSSIISIIDIRTEPVALQILSTVFPTVRIWPRDTSAMAAGSVRDLSQLILKGDLTSAQVLALSDFAVPLKTDNSWVEF